MQKFIELLNAVGNCLCGAAKLFEEFNHFRETSRNIPVKDNKSETPKIDGKKK